MSDTARKGGISVNTENIFPIIKKWLYSEKEIFIRELVSNASDAITKLARLASLGEVRDLELEGRIDVTLNKSEKTITISDNGIGMTADELDRYICNIALSGALEFIEKYEGKGGGDGIIGHFGLGFYSAFMVADRVEIVTKSFKDEPAVRWVCEENGSYDVYDDAERERGTSVILHVNEEGEEYLNEYKLREMLSRYCSFMPIEIYLSDEERDDEPAAEGEEAEKSASKPINNTHPLWTKQPSECTDEEYKAFYHEVFGDMRDPLFYMHINADYPLNFKGIIYFPRLRENYENLEGKIKLYYNQVFVADNIKEVIPEYLLMLRGVLDCPELPLNVSRSYLQNSGYVSKISAHITKKVADKLNSLFNSDREKFEEMWKDVKTFVEYACVCDRKFYDRLKGSLLFELCGGGYKTLEELVGGGDTAESTDAEEKKDSKKIVYYAADQKGQAQLISLYRARGIDVALLGSILDSRFIETVEQNGGNVKFVRIDSDTEAIRGEGDTTLSEATIALFESIGGEEKLKVESDRFSDERIPAILKVSEESRRFREMMRMYAPDQDELPSEETLVINTASPIVEGIEKGRYGELAGDVARYVYYLAVVARGGMSEEEIKSFFDIAYKIADHVKE